MKDAAPVSEADLHAYVDGRLEAPRREQVDAWLASHEGDAQRVADWQRSRDALRSLYGPILEEPIPESLELAARGSVRERRSGRARWIGLAAAWMAVGAALGVLAGWELHSVPNARARLADAAIAHRAAIAHAVYSPEVRHPVEVGADQEEHLVAWLSKRLGTKLRVPKLDAAGMALVGGRLLPGDSGPVAQFMYQSDRGRRITVYVRAGRSPQPETAFRYAREDGVNVFYWIEPDRGYAIASSDLGKDELLKVATMVYQQLEP